MAGLYFSYIQNFTRARNPHSFLYLVCPANQRLKILRINLTPLGATGAKAAVNFEIVKATGAPSGGALTVIKDPPEAAENPLSNAAGLGAISAEGTVSTIYEEFGVHPQGTILGYVPKGGFHLIPGGQARVIRFLGEDNIDVRAQVWMEE